MLATADLQVESLIAPTDADLLRDGMDVELLDEASGQSLSGTLTSLGDQVEQSDSGDDRGRKAVVTGLERIPNEWAAVMLPAATAAADFTNDEAQYGVLIETRPGAAQLIASQAAMALRPQDPDRLEVSAPPDPKRLRESIDDNFRGLLYGLAGLALLVGMIGIANTTLVAVLERRSEIGVRRALGARRRHIAGQFLTESATLGLIGGILGTRLGILVVVFVSSQRDWTTTLDPMFTLPAPLIGAATGLLAGLQPALRAAGIAPASALRSQ